MSSVIVGISASHDASACVLVDGKLEMAVQLERITRIKRDGLPFLSTTEAVDYCLTAAGLVRSDVDCFAFNSQALLPEYFGLSQPVQSADFDLFDAFGDKSLFVSHHLAHAFSAHFCSPFENSAVLVIDGSGGSTIDGEDKILNGTELQDYLHSSLKGRPALHTESVYRFDSKGFKLMDRQFAKSFNTRCGSSSPGETYASVAQYIFGDWHASGKVMGLSPYGDPEKYSPSLLQVRDGLKHFSQSWKSSHSNTYKKDPMEYADLAARVQRDLEDIVIERSLRAIKFADSPNLAYAGGVALNSVANAKVSAAKEIGQLYVIPASHDAGISIGVAAAAYFRLTGNTKGQVPQNDFLGYQYRDSDIHAAINEEAGILEIQPFDAEVVAADLAEGKIVGLYQGRSEFGPRALGHRSILGDPRRKETWRDINRLVKFREDFRPFAPAVIESEAQKYFELKEAERYMLRVVQVKDEYKCQLGAVTHVDGSARVQTVVREENEVLYALLESFKKKTGLPILLNTSMNVRGQPVVETPAQALEMLTSTFMDSIVLEDKYIKLAKFDEHSLCSNDKIILNKNISITKILEGSAAYTQISCPMRKKKYQYPSYIFDFLAGLNSMESIQSGIDIFPTEVRDECMAILSSLFRLKFVHVV